MKLINVRGLHVVDGREFAKIDYDYYIPNAVASAMVTHGKKTKEDGSTHSYFRFVIEFTNKLRLFGSEYMAEYEANSELLETLREMGHEL